MRRMSSVILSSLIVFVAACAAPPASQPLAARGRATLFEGARLISGDEAAPIEDSAFVVQDGQFTSVGRRGEVQAPEGAARVDLTGKTVMPGIIEAHAHLGYWKDLKPSAENFTRENLLSDLQRLAYHGVVAVYSMGADRREIAWPLRDELRTNPRPDAAMYLSAGGLAMPKGGPFTPLDEAVRMVTNEEDVRKEIRELVAKKADFIKVWQDSRRQTPSEVITAATRNSAELLGLDQLGTVASGKNADFLMLDANPLDNIANTRRISHVYLRGGEVDRAALRTQWNGGSAAATRPPTTD